MISKSLVFSPEKNSMNPFRWVRKCHQSRRKRLVACITLANLAKIGHVTCNRQTVTADFCRCQHEFKRTSATQFRKLYFNNVAYSYVQKEPNDLAPVNPVCKKGFQLFLTNIFAEIIKTTVKIIITNFCRDIKKHENLRRNAGKVLDKCFHCEKSS